MRISQPAASRLASEAEAILGAPLYLREGRGIVLTAEGAALALRAERILAELEDAGRELDEMREGLSGVVRIGSVTGPAVEHVLPMLRQARLSLPQVKIEIVVNTSDILGEMLLDGRLDFALARTPAGHDPALFEAQVVSVEPVSLIVRRGHPALREAPSPAASLMEYDWVLPFEGAILRRAVEAELAVHKLALPKRILNTSSFLLTMATIAQTNAIAPIASSVVRAFATAEGPAPGIVALPSPLMIEVEPYALMGRAGRRLPPAAEAARAILREVISAPK
ncbi:MAG: DNA-binding transcriptional LysR family regulator [Halocynthiibacter sp.]|jgi:DNA-binding transcriptional LysR family regulator